jgi:hypothetical protein
MIILKKLLILLLVLAAMYVAYVAVNFLKSKINGRKSMGFVLLLVFLSFGAVFLIILTFGFLLTEFKDFFFTH